MTPSEPRGPAVLVVEHEPLVRMTAADALEEAGFQVLEAANADAALTVLEARSDEGQVMFTDGNMPARLRDPGRRSLGAEVLSWHHPRAAHHREDAGATRSIERALAASWSPAR
jgi:CheY-like chemotaxis protein